MNLDFGISELYVFSALLLSTCNRTAAMDVISKLQVENIASDRVLPKLQSWPFGGRCWREVPFLTKTVILNHSPYDCKIHMSCTCSQWHGRDWHCYWPRSKCPLLYCIALIALFKILPEWLAIFRPNNPCGVFFSSGFLTFSTMMCIFFLFSTFISARNISWHMSLKGTLSRR